LKTERHGLGVDRAARPLRIPSRRLRSYGVSGIGAVVDAAHTALVMRRAHEARCLGGVTGGIGNLEADTVNAAVAAALSLGAERERGVAEEDDIGQRVAVASPTRPPARRCKSIGSGRSR